MGLKKPGVAKEMTLVRRLTRFKKNGSMGEVHLVVEVLALSRVKWISMSSLVIDLLSLIFFFC